jgi:hypothetical protein
MQRKRRERLKSARFANRAGPRHHSAMRSRPTELSSLRTAGGWSCLWKLRRQRLLSTRLGSWEGPLGGGPG